MHQPSTNISSNISDIRIQAENLSAPKSLKKGLRNRKLRTIEDQIPRSIKAASALRKCENQLSIKKSLRSGSVWAQVNNTKLLKSRINKNLDKSFKNSDAELTLPEIPTSRKTPIKSIVKPFEESLKQAVAAGLTPKTLRKQRLTSLHEELSKNSKADRVNSHYEVSSGASNLVSSTVH